jgi:hypothetical protein
MEEFLCNTIDILKKIELANDKVRRDCSTKILER